MADMAGKYHVLGILSCRGTSGEEEYLVRWEETYVPTWEPRNILFEDCPDILEEFHKVSNAKHWWVVVHMPLFTGIPTVSSFNYVSGAKLESTIMGSS